MQPASNPSSSRGDTCRQIDLMIRPRENPRVDRGRRMEKQISAL
jgi:hypothetical protein